MKKSIFILLGFIIAGVIIAQESEPLTFTTVREFGQNRPRVVEYNANADIFAWIDDRGRLVLVDGPTQEVRHIIYESGFYNAYKFSPDGRWFALAIEERVELWDTSEGAIGVSIEPEGAFRTEGPLFFSLDGGLLSFNTQIRAPAALRRSENDTVNLPWVWDLGFARRERRSTLPNFVEAMGFFDYRNGFIFGPNNKIIAGLPQRLDLTEVTSDGTELLAEIPSQRFEPDPITVWFGTDSEAMYVLPKGDNDLIQIDTRTGNHLTLPSYAISRNFSQFESLAYSDMSRIVGAAGSVNDNSVLQLLLGSGYLDQYSYHSLTVTLIDYLVPQTPSAEQGGFLLYIFDNDSDFGQFRFVWPQDVQHIALHPDGVQFLAQRFSGQIELYNLETGLLEKIYQPETSNYERSILHYNADGSVIYTDYQQLDAETGDTLYINWDYLFELDNFYFTSDDRHVVTLFGSQWRFWDLLTGDLVREEELQLRGSIMDVTDDAHSYLTRLDGDGATTSLTGMEVVDVGMERRRSVFFENLRGRSIVNILPSPDWENYLVIYSGTPYDSYGEGNVISMYNLNNGKQWLIAGDDLPYTGNRNYGWLDNETIFVYGQRTVPDQPSRIFDLDYHGSGLPMCIVEAFPDDYPQWLGYWEFLTINYHATDRLGLLTKQLCDVVPGTVADVEAVLYPSPTPTRYPVTATPSSIAGVPACLTSRFPTQAREYAEDWRNMTRDLPAEQIEELTVLLCQSISGSSEVNDEIADNFFAQYMTINAYTGRRDVGTNLPPQESDERTLQVIRDTYRQRGLSLPDNIKLSNDGELLGAITNQNRLVVYNMSSNYDEIVFSATATAVGYQPPDDVLRISLRPTATKEFVQVGTPRPTLTPTVTPTPPPPAEQVVPQDNLGAIEEICPSQDTVYTMQSLPPEYDASGYILVTMGGGGQYGNRPLILQPETGDIFFDENTLNCQFTNCEYSYDKTWVVTQDNGFVLSRPDGQGVIRLSTDVTGGIQSWRWLDLHTLEFRYQQYVQDAELRENPTTFVQRFDPTTNTLTEPIMTRDIVIPSININDLSYEVISEQGGLDNRYALVRTAFNTGYGTGYKYYIYDRETEEALYFARLSDERDVSIGIESFWHPLRDVLYYRYPFGEHDEWYIFDTVTRAHYFLGELPGGTWSRDGRYRIQTYSLPFEDEDERIEADLPIHRISIWDREDGLTRRYCVPNFVDDYLPQHTEFYWSLDSRYVAFLVQLPDDFGNEAVPTRTWVLDTHSGYITEISTQAQSIIVWGNE